MNNWYEIVSAEEPLTQGDFIFNCPVPTWKNNEPIEIEGKSEAEILQAYLEFISADVIVITQACDLAHDKIQNITLCEHFSLTAFREDWESAMRTGNQNPTTKAWKKQCEFLNDGYVWNQTILNKCDLPDFIQDYRVVDFHDIHTVPKTFLESTLKKRKSSRIRLLPPYREHLSQAFARFYMRVGLPIDIKLKDLIGE
jgi:hypothetical protein